MSYHDTLIESLESAGEVLLKHFGNIREGSFDRKSDIDLVTVADKEAEVVIKRIIAGAHPDHEILAEESGLQKGRQGGMRWLIDPVDGTTNFAHGCPIFSVSIALEKDGEMVLAGVYNPYHKETWLAEKGSGATHNGKKIKVSDISEVKNALVVSGFPYDRRERVHHYLKAWELMIGRAQGLLRLGSAALDLCYVASGRVEAYWEESLHPWDTAAGWLIAEEAGATVTDFGGERFNPYKKQVLATNGKVHEEMLAVLRERQAWTEREFPAEARPVMR